MKRLKIGIIGAGNMGQAIMRGMAQTRGVTLLVAEQDSARARHAARRYAITAATIERLTNECSAIIISVKPQDIDAVLTVLRRSLTPRTCVISVAAGISTAYLTRRCGAGIDVVRVMPNMPGLIGEGMSAFCLAKRARPAARRLTQYVFSRLGETLEVREHVMDAVTALSGSGPAFIAAVLESLIAAGQRQGLTRATAARLVLATARGTALLLTHHRISPSVLIQKVASPGGTTAAGLAVMQRRRAARLIEDVIAAATQRARQLRRV